jgi:23S rRNA (adenine2503-C2)-methyltransferase
MEKQKNLEYNGAFYLPSGRIFLVETKDKYLVECTEMRDVTVEGKQHEEVRLSQDPRVIWKHLKSYDEKWLLTVSTQKGCVHKCQFCDVPTLPFRGNLSIEEMDEQVKYLLEASPYVQKCAKAKIGYSRMGEPAHNLDAVLESMSHLPQISSSMGREFNWLPCFNTILPRKTIGNKSGYDVIDRVMRDKEEIFNGRLHFQISCNSTNEEYRKKLFGGADVLTVSEAVERIKKFPSTGRTVTLNYIIMQGVPLELEELKKLELDSDRFRIKLIPLNDTNNGTRYNLIPNINYRNYEELVKLGKKFEDAGVPTIIDAIAISEEAGLCCGQLAALHPR